MANISDSTCTRFGRRRPYIAFGAFLCASWSIATYSCHLAFYETSSAFAKKLKDRQSLESGPLLYHQIVLETDHVYIDIIAFTRYGTGRTFLEGWAANILILRRDSWREVLDQLFFAVFAARCVPQPSRRIYCGVSLLMIMIPNLFSSCFVSTALSHWQTINICVECS